VLTSFLFLVVDLARSKQQVLSQSKSGFNTLQLQASTVAQQERNDFKLHTLQSRLEDLLSSSGQIKFVQYNYVRLFKLKLAWDN